MVKQKNVNAYIEAFNAEFSTNQNTKILQQGTYTFDVFIEEVFPTLSTGGTVVVYPKKGGFDFVDLWLYKRP
jgi:non-ribosomal peptide synthetase component F